MSNKKYNPLSIEEITFDSEDLAIFQIKDIKERVVTLREMFFPRLQFLQKKSLELIELIYDVNPYDGMSDFNSPNNRLDAKTNTAPESVTIGRSGKRRNSQKDEPLKVLNGKGKPTYVHSAHLRYVVSSDGIMAVEFLPFSFSICSDTVEQIRLEILDNIEVFTQNLSPLQICFCDPEMYRISEDEDLFKQAINSKNFGIPKKKSISNFCFFVAIELPVESSVMIQHLQNCYIALYPLFHLCISLGNGTAYDLAEMLQKFNRYFYASEEIDTLDEESKNSDRLDSNSENQPLIKTEVNTFVEEVDLSNTDIPEQDEREKDLVEVAKRQGQQQFKSKLLRAYESKCAVTGCDVKTVLEAAHIIPYKGVKTDILENGLLLRVDIHRLFDAYLISIDPESITIVVHDSLMNSPYQKLSGKKIKLPKDQKSCPSRNAIKNHYEKFIGQDN